MQVFSAGQLFPHYLFMNNAAQEPKECMQRLLWAVHSAACYKLHNKPSNSVTVPASLEERAGRAGCIYSGQNIPQPARDQ